MAFGLSVAVQSNNGKYAQTIAQAIAGADRP
jgi:hypothetical protein